MLHIDIATSNTFDDMDQSACMTYVDLYCKQDVHLPNIQDHISVLFRPKL